MEKSHIKLVEDLIKAQGESLEIHDALWQEKPVSPSVFFEKFIHEPCYPEQQKFVDAVLGQNGEEWDIKYDEAIALCGKGCLVGSTELLDVSTGDIVTINELVENNKTISVHSWDGKSVVVKSTKVPYIKGKAITYDIETDQGQSCVTGEHLLYTKRGWVTADNLTTDDKICSPKFQSLELPEYNISDEKIKLIGYLIGDGNLSNGKDKYPTVKFYNSNRTVLHDFSKIINILSSNIINSIPVPKTYNNSSVVCLTRKNQRVGSSPNIINSITRRFGIYGVHGRDKTVPKEFFKLSDRQLKVFISALWSTDGWIYSNSLIKSGFQQVEIGYCSASRKLCEQLILLLKRFGVTFRLNKKIVNNRVYWNVTTRNKHDCRLFCELISVVGKEDKQSKLLKTINYRSTKKYVRSLINNQASSNIIWAKITNITKNEPEYYYDLEVEDTECYFAQGLLHHNSGKDRTIAKILTYCIYKLLCMRNPQHLLDLNNTEELGPTSAIDIGNVSLNARLAKDVFFKNFVTMVKVTKNPKTNNNWFEEHGLNFQKDVLTREIKFPKDITVYSLDSEEYTGEGLNLLVIVFDEVGGFEPKKAEELYRALVTTQKTRFGQNRKTMLLSYKRDDNDFMMIRYQQAENEKRTFRVKAATWVWNIKRSKDDFIDDYIKNPEDSKRIFECEGSTAQEGYFKYKQRIKEIINPNRINPIQGDIWWTDNILKLKFKDFFAPLKNERYFVHADLAKGKITGDYCGFALGHAVKNQSVKLNEEYIKSLIQAEGFGITKIIDQKQPAVVIDLVLQIRARPGQEVIFDEIRQFIQSLKYAGFFIQTTTFDGWQSIDSIQMLKKSGINAEVQSVDRNTEAYDTLKEQVYKGLLDIYSHPTFIRECEELIRTNSGKVDHPEFSYKRSVEEGRMEGSKDVSDAVAACVNLCIKNAKSCFSFGVSGSSDRKNNKRKPDDDNPDKLVFYGQRL